MYDVTSCLWSMVRPEGAGGVVCPMVHPEGRGGVVHPGVCVRKIPQN